MDLNLITELETLSMHNVFARDQVTKDFRGSAQPFKMQVQFPFLSFILA